MVNLAHRLAVVVGGGDVGRRKIAAVLAAGGRVRVVALEPSPSAMPGVEWIAEAYRKKHLIGSHLVFAAATVEVNRVVVADARALGIWVNSATEPESGDFVLPAVARRGRLTIAVGTGGASPAVARRVADRLASQFDTAFADWLDLLAEMRPMVLARVADPDRRRRLLESWADLAWPDQLRRVGKEALRDEWRAQVEALAPSSGPPV